MAAALIVYYCYQAQNIQVFDDLFSLNGLIAAFSDITRDSAW
jgi:hypothetical protein